MYVLHFDGKKEIFIYIFVCVCASKIGTMFPVYGVLTILYVELYLTITTINKSNTWSGLLLLLLALGAGHGHTRPL